MLLATLPCASVARHIPSARSGGRPIGGPVRCAGRSCYHAARPACPGSAPADGPRRERSSARECGGRPRRLALRRASTSSRRGSRCVGPLAFHRTRWLLQLRVSVGRLSRDGGRCDCGLIPFLRARCSVKSLGCSSSLCESGELCSCVLGVSMLPMAFHRCEM